MSTCTIIQRIELQARPASYGNNSRGAWTEMCDGEMSESQLSKRMMREVLTALQLFVNDGANELHFAINSLARNFLRPPASDGSGGGGGTLIAIVNTEAERKIAESCLTKADEQKVAALRYYYFYVLRPILRCFYSSLNPPV